MPRIFRKFFGYSKVGKIVFVVVSIAASSYLASRFIFARASSNQINIYPDSFTLEQDDNVAKWDGIGHAFYQDLSPQAGFGEFNKDNSAFIIGSDSPTSTDQSSQTFSTSTPSFESVQPAIATSAPEKISVPETQTPPLDAPQASSSEPAIPTPTQDAAPAAPATESPVQAPAATDTAPASVQEPAPADNNPAPASATTPEQPALPPAGNTTSLLYRFKLAGEGIKKTLAKLFRFDQARAEDGQASQSARQSIIFSGFNLPREQDVLIDNVQLRMSMAASSSNPGDSIDVEYSLDGGSSWNGNGNIYLDQERSNATNGGYYLFALPVFEDWRDIGKMKVRVSYISAGGDFRAAKAYLDAIWVEVNTKDSEDSQGKVKGEEEKAGPLVRPDDFEFSMTSDKKDFKIDDEPNFKFKFKKKQSILGMIGSGLSSLFYDQYKDVRIDANLVGRGSEMKPMVAYLANGEFSVQLPKMSREFRPGRQHLEMVITDPTITSGEPVTFTQDFNWGVLAFNTNKSVYLPTETAYLQMGVVDDAGHTICNAHVSLEITAPDGGIAYLNSDNGLVVSNPACGLDNVIKVPDYYAHYGLAGVGTYKVKLTAQTANGPRTLDDQFEVRNSVPFEIERTGPTRIFPKADYEMKLRIKADEDYSGDITDYVPLSFNVYGGKLKILSEDGDEFYPSGVDFSTGISNISDKLLIWHGISLKKGETLELSYEINPPDESPEFFLLGPAQIGGFVEARNWQIASDAVDNRARTAQFIAGTYTGNGTTGQNSDTNQTFATFNFKLAEQGVVIKNAYIIFEAQVQAYSALGANNYTGYSLAFDTCQAPCTANAWTGTSTATVNDSATIYAETTNGNDNLRFLFDVTNEAQLAAYTGTSTLNAQLGYNIKRGAAANAIANAKAKLVVTYLYDPTSPSFTNTVFYPLESTAAGDSGSRQAATTTNCIFGTSCPNFNYNLTIPEFSVATGSASTSQWFETYVQNYNTSNGNTNDIWTMMKIGTNATSSNFVYEGSRLGDQGALPVVYFPSVPGVVENTAQTIGFRASSTNYSFYMIGGEVAETYTASTSAQTKTRTVSFPLGVLNNAPSTASSTASVNVYFPENGMAATGTVSIQKAWFRIISNNFNRLASPGYNSVTLLSKIGSRASTTPHVYNYNPSGEASKLSFNIISVIPSTEYAELASANATIPELVTLQTKASSTNQGGVSAELMITYTYTSDASGYLTSLQLFGGQSAVNSNVKSTTTPIAYSLLPETSGMKTMLAGALLPSFLITDSSGTVNTAPAATMFDANISTGTPTCTNAFRSDPDDINGFTEYYKNVVSILSTTTNQSYNACYSTDGNSKATEGAKMNGQLFYTYGYQQSLYPTGAWNSAAQKMDGSGAVDLSMDVNDQNQLNCRVKIEYVAGSDCNFASPGKSTVSTTSVTSDFGSVAVDNDSAYQVGTSSGWIITTSGSNTVNFDWLSQTDLPNADGIYCLRLTANNTYNDQQVPTTTLVTLDNVAPTAPGQMTATSTVTTASLTFGSQTTENHFSRYRAFYKQGTSSVSELDSEIIDTDLNYQDYNGSSGLTVRGLDPDTDYVFNIWAYDTSGNKTASTEVTVRTLPGSIRANTVKFYAGLWTYDGATSSALLTNATNTLPAFDFKLGEQGISIKSAYLVFEAQAESFPSSKSDYTGYQLAFGSCASPCTPVPTSSLVYTDNTMLAASSTNNVSDNIRLLFDITNEPGIKSYAGNGQDYSGQLAFNFLTNKAATSSIANAKAVLVLTYTYSETESDNFTNTVIYPLESASSTDSGSASRAVINGCVLDSTCPTFKYNMNVPEITSSSSNISQWFDLVNDNYGNAGTDIISKVNINGSGAQYNIETPQFIYSAKDNNAQSNTLDAYFTGVSGYAENTNQVLEYNANAYDLTGTVLFYMVGGEVAETYIASTSAAVKTRTVSFPMQITPDITAAGTIYSGSANVYFPENGAGTSNVTVKKMWFRMYSDNNSNNAVRTLTVSTKVGTNPVSSNKVYNMRPGTDMGNTIFTLYHVASSSADMAALQAANATTPVNVTFNVQGSSNRFGGVSGEFFVTYAYTSEADGHLTNLTTFGGQPQIAGTSMTATSAAFTLIPENSGTAYIRSGGLLVNGIIQSPTGAIVNGNVLFDAELSTGTPVCTNAYVIRPDTRNDFVLFYNNVASALTTATNQTYNVCYSTNGGGTNNGSKFGSQLIYTYQWNAPPQTYTQNDWRWYDNIDASLPVNPKNDENSSISNVNLGDILRVRMNLVDNVRYTATGTQAFKMQYAWGENCATTTNWTDVGTTAQTTASWRAYDNASVSGGASASSTLLASSTVVESYEENNPSAANIARLNVNDQGEWDWTLYNYSATSSQQYCFRMTESDGTVIGYNSDSYPYLVTAPANTAPNQPTLIGQYRGTGTSTPVSNQAWVSTSTVTLAASVTDVNLNEGLKLYFQLIYSTSTFSVSTVEPGSYCTSGTAYNSCASKIWRASSTVLGDFRINPYIGTTTITGLPDSVSSSTGYMWQVLACDKSAACSAWGSYGATPNFKVDTVSPTRPGSLAFYTKTSTSVTVTFGASTTESFFQEYKIFYKAGSSGVTESDNHWTQANDANLGYIDYNGATSTTITGLTAGTQYVFNIWAYDSAGNKASGTTELLVTTSSGFNSPSVIFNSLAEKTDGSGAIDVSIYVSDPDNDNTERARITYAAYNGNPCASTSLYSYQPAYIDPTDANTYAYAHGTFNPNGDPKVDDGSYYQIGTSTGYILTSNGGSDVQFDWLSKSDIPSANGTYCVMAVVYDGTAAPNPYATATQMIIIDNLSPVVPGALTFNSRTDTQIKLNFGSPSSDTQFKNYKIFYSTSSPVSESSYQWSDTNLNDVNFYGATTTTITGLLAGTQYYFNIWAYDYNGNKSSSTQMSASTDYVPADATSTLQLLSDGVTQISNSGWSPNSTVKFKASATDGDASEDLTLYFQVIANAGTFLTATTVPQNACVSGTTYSGCASNVWMATSTMGNYSVTPFTATITVASIPDSSSGYKWQVLVCDNDNICSAWTKFSTTTPNFEVDTIPPTAPGTLSQNSVTANSVNLNFGATTTETNFTEYRIYYATSTPVTESSYLESSSTDPNLGYINFNGASFTTIDNLLASTTYYFAIWAYDQAGNKASSSAVSITTNNPQSTPGIIFYTKNTRVLYYKTWSGTAWSTEKSGPTFGSGAGGIRHIRSVRSDDGSRVGIILKTWDGTNQQFFGAVYRVAAGDFISTTSLQSAIASANYASTTDADIAALSGGEFMVVKGGITANGTTMYSWNGTVGWTNEGAGPDPGQRITYARFTRRPNTDNYILTTFDASANINTAYYAGGSTYSDSWTTITRISSNEQDIYNFVGDAFFDQTDNTSGAINFTDSATGLTYTKAKYLAFDNTTITYGAATSSPAGGWTARYINGEFATDPAGNGIAYFSGRNSTGQLNVYKVDISSSLPIFTLATNGSNISAGTLYATSSKSQSPFASIFYKNGKAVQAWNANSSATPKYRMIDTQSNSIDSADTAVPGAAAGVWSRVRFVKDPNEQEFLAYYQNSTKDYYAVFWNGAGNKFYNTTNNPGSGQVWTAIATTTGNFSYNDECVSFAYGKRRSSPNAPTVPLQYKSDGVTAIANGGWTNQSQVVLQASDIHPDTYAQIIMYFNVVTATGTFATSTSQPTGTCNSGTAYNSCASKIWTATSTFGDYSTTPFTGTTSIASLPDSGTSTQGYKWQVMVCDDQAKCTSWVAYNATAPNFKIDTVAPTAPGGLTILGKNSYSITLGFGSQTSEMNFSQYKIFYKAGSSGVTEGDTMQNDSNLNYINFNGKASTTVINLASSTQYVFNIWAYDLAGNKATGSSEISTTTNAAPFLNQSSFIFENDDGAGVNSNSAAFAVEATSTNMVKGERINVRIQVENTGGDISNNQVFRLQYENFTDNPGTWLPVGASSDISYSYGLSGSNGDIITSSKAAANGKIWTYGAWHENTNLTNSFSLSNGYYTEFVFAIQTANAVAGKTYRLRLTYNDGYPPTPLNGYSKYPALTISSSQAKIYSKGTYSSLPAGYSAATYYLDPKGYSDTLTDDSSRDPLSSAANFPISNFTIATTTNTKAMTATWNGQSSVAAGTNAVYLQVYRFGTTNAWVTVATNTTANASTDFNLSANINSKLSEYYDGSYKTYWRVYQASGTENLQSDYFNISFTDPTPYVSQLHYLWRYDNGSESTAGSVEPEDNGYPTQASTTYPQIGSTTRLRFDVANTGGGAASAYTYRIEFATTTTNCATDPGGWVAVPTTLSAAFRATTSANFANGASTTKQMADTEGYNFTAGYMVQNPSNTTGAQNLTESQYTEIEYAIGVTNYAVPGTTYCFRVTNAGTVLNAYGKLAELTVAGITNFAPTWMGGGYPDDGGSASTSPTNYGSNVVFEGTATTSDAGDYYLAICKTNSVTAGNDAPPTCNGGSWCISGLASSSAPATCSYTTATTSEELAWYGFACDKHPGTGVAKCSSMSQGDTGTSLDSPFDINHAPTFSNIYTSVNNQNPGGTFVINSTSTDTDVIGGQDAISLFVCTTNSATYAGCTATTVCSVIATTTANPSCSYAAPIPTVSGTVTYYAFVFDSHNMAATSNSRSSSYSVNNTPPTLGTLFLNNGNPITLNIRGMSDTQVQLTASTTDLNGCSTLVSGTAVAYFSNVTNGYNCANNNNNCYQINSANCVKTGCSGSVASYVCTANFKYYAIPTDNSTGNPNVSYNWLGRMTVYDGANYTSTSSQPVELNTTTALDVTENNINFGSALFAGQNTGSTNQPSTIVNSGNSPIDSNISGTDMAGNPSGTINVSNIKWDFNNFDWSATGTPLTTGGVDVNIDEKKPTSTVDVSNVLYWGVGIPFGSPVSTYSGYNTFSVIIDPTNW